MIVEVLGCLSGLGMCVEGEGSMCVWVGEGSMCVCGWEMPNYVRQGGVSIS